jgi:hypothetical protein
MRDTTPHTAGPPWPDRHRPAPAPQHPTPSPTPPVQHPATTRALKLPARQPPLDLDRVRPYRDHSASARYTALPDALRQKDTGRAFSHAPIGKVPPPTNSQARGQATDIIGAHNAAKPPHP